MMMIRMVDDCDDDVDVLDAQKLFTTEHRSISQRVVVQSHDDAASNCCGLDEGKVRQGKYTHYCW